MAHPHRPARSQYRPRAVPAPQAAERQPRRRRWRHASLVVSICLASLAALVFIFGLVIDGPLRGYMERKLNSKLEGYTAHLQAADFHPFGFGLDLTRLTLVQDAQPEPPVLDVERLRASVHWKAILRGRLVADFRVDKPSIYLDRRHAELEQRDNVPIQSRGWQDALQAIYPLKINELRVDSCEVTYADTEHARPLQLHSVGIVATNIRNIRSRDRTYPSEFHLQGVVFERGRLQLDGHADLLAKPHAGVEARIELADVLVDYFAPLLAAQNIVVRHGVLSARGQVEYAPTVKLVTLEDLTLRDLDAEYVHGTNQARERQHIQQVASAARQAEATPVQLYARRMAVENSRLSWMNRSTNPPYRLFVSDMNLTVENLSNRFTRGPATAAIEGKFMGSGALVAAAQFRPEQRGPDFDMKLQIQGTPLVLLNDLLRAHGRFDVVDGKFALFSELQVQNGSVRGYVKPLFKDVDVYDSKQDKGFFSNVWEAVVGAVATLLSNRERDEVATVADLSGPLGDPDTSTLQVIGNLVRNAFFDAILPGFDRDVKKAAH